MTKIISFANQKGGVGKSTLCLQTAFALAERMKKKVLVIDFDAQGNTTSRLAPREVDGNGETQTLLGNTHTVDLFNEQLEEIEVTRCPCGADLIPTLKNDPRLFDKEAAPLHEAAYPASNIRTYLQKNKYDYVLIDCPPSLGRKLVASLAMSTHVVSPIKLSGFAADGLEGLLTTINNIQQTVNPDLKIAGIIINDMVNSVAHTRAFNEITAAVPELVFNNKIMNRPPIDTATSEGVPIWKLQYAHVAAKEVAAVVDELIKRVK